MNIHDKCKTVRKYIREHPDSNSAEIKGGVGFPVAGVLMRLTKHKMITFTAKLNNEGHRPHLFRETPERVKEQSQ